MFRFPKIAVLTMIVFTLIFGKLPAARAEISAEKVRRSIAMGVDYLKRTQNKSTGGWQAYSVYNGGVTALCTMALIHSGVSPKDPAVLGGLNYLRKVGRSKSTYVIALQTMAYCAADPEKDRLAIQQNVALLEAGQLADGERKGAWGYFTTSPPGTGDNSNTQFALLALHEAEKAGVKVSDRTWRLALDYWRRSQNADGSWGYAYPRHTSATGSMTCAGIASLIIASGRVNSGSAAVAGGNVQCCGAGGDDTAERLERALQWLGAHFRVNENPGGPGTFAKKEVYYYRYAMERAGRLSGRRFFIGRNRRARRLEPHDWYRKGAEVIVSVQDSFTGRWVGEARAETQPAIATAFALLFLSKGRWPVVMAKVKHGGGFVLGEESGRDWDRHTGGVPNLTRYAGKRWRRELTWQTVDLRGAAVDDLLQSPVLFFSGADSLDLAPAEKESLKEYIHQGGFVFAEARHGDGCDGRKFHESFQRLAKELFPDSQLRKLRPDHPIWFAEQKVIPSNKRPLWGVEACCRTSLVYCPRNLSCYWELFADERKMDYPAEVQQDLKQAMAVGVNVLAYATNRDPKYKLERPRAVVGEPAVETTERGVITVAKISHPGGADDAPNALANLLRFAGRQFDLTIDAKRRVLSPADAELFNHPIAFMHGRRNFQFSPEERKELANYLNRGGFLLADAICASKPFLESFQSEMKAIFPGAQLVQIPSDHPLFTEDFRGFDISVVTLSDPQSRAAEDPLKARLVKTPPYLLGLTIEDRLAVVFSPYDLSCALENHTSLECKGYTRDDAIRIGVNVLLYALQQ